MILVLTRDQYLPDCTLGGLIVADKHFFTIERPWVPDPTCRSGVKYRSCIAEGSYRMTQFTRPSGEKTFRLSNPLLDVYEDVFDVPRGREESTRTLILIHAANFVFDVIGCIGVGLERTKTTRGWMVTNSREAMNQLRTLVAGTYDNVLNITRIKVNRE